MSCSDLAKFHMLQFPSIGINKTTIKYNLLVAQRNNLIKLIIRLLLIIILRLKYYPTKPHLIRFILVI